MIFIDTGAYIARYIEKDRLHEQAVLAWQEIRTTAEICFTSNFVLDETLTLLARRAGYKFACERASNIYASRSLTILRPTHESEIRALRYFEKYADQRVSFTDCVSFALMESARIKRVFSFDQHFALAGLVLLPGTPGRESRGDLRNSGDPVMMRAHLNELANGE